MQLLARKMKVFRQYFSFFLVLVLSMTSFPVSAETSGTGTEGAASTAAVETLYEETFENGMPSNAVISTSASNYWSVSGGNLIASWMGTTDSPIPNSAMKFDCASVLSDRTEYTVSVDVVSKRHSGTTQNYPYVGLYTLSRDTTALEVRAQVISTTQYKVWVQNAAVSAVGYYTPEGGTGYGTADTVSFNLATEVSGNTLNVYVDNHLALTYDLSNETNVTYGTNVNLKVMRFGAYLDMLTTFDNLTITAPAAEEEGPVAVDGVYYAEDFEGTVDGWTDDTYWTVADGCLNVNFVWDSVGKKANASKTFVNEELQAVLGGLTEYVIGADLTYAKDTTNTVYPAFAMWTINENGKTVEPRLFVTSKDTYRMQLYNRNTASFVLTETFTVEGGDNGFDTGTVAFNLQTELKDGMISWYIDGVKAFEYALSNFAALTYKDELSLFAMRNGSNNTTVDITIDNLKVTDAVVLPPDYEIYYEETFDGTVDGWTDTAIWTVTGGKIKAEWPYEAADGTKIANSSKTFTNTALQAVLGSMTEYVVNADITYYKDTTTVYPILAMFTTYDNNATIEPRLKVTAKDRYNLQLYNRNTKTFVLSESFTLEGGDNGYGTDTVSFNLAVELKDGMMNWYIDGVKAFEYALADFTALSYKDYLTFFAMRNGSNNTNIKLEIDNLIISDKVLLATGEEEPEGIEQTDKVVASEDGFIVIETDHFTDYAEGEVGTWVWDDCDTGSGDWTIADGLLNNRQDNVTTSTIALSNEKLYPFGSVQVDVMLTSTNTDNIYAGPVAAYNGAMNYYHLRLADMSDGTNRLQLYRMDEGTAVGLASAGLGFTIQRNKWYEIKMTIKDGVIYGYVDGTQYIAYDTSNNTIKYEFGAYGVRASRCSAVFDNLIIQLPEGDELISQDFEGLTSLEGTSWAEVADSGSGTWSVADGVLSQGNESASGSYVMLYDDETSRTFGGVSMDLMFDSANTGNLYAGPVAAYNGTKNYYHLRLADMADGTNLLQLYKMTSGTATKLTEAVLPFTIERNSWYNVGLYQYDDILYGYVDGIPYIAYTPEEGIIYSEGLTGFRISQGSAKVDNFRTCDAIPVGEATVLQNTTVVENPLTYTDDFNDETAGTSPDYWLEQNTKDEWKTAQIGDAIAYGTAAATTSATWLHVFETNVDMTAKLYVPSEAAAADAKTGLIIRLSGTNADVRAGYDFATGKWYLEDDKGDDFEEQIIYADAATEFAKDTWHTVRVRAVGKTVQVWCDNVLVLESSQIGQATTGRVGVFTKNAAVYTDDVSLQLLSGQGRVEKAAVADYMLDDDEYIEGSSLYWYSDDLAIINYNSRLWFSYDEGQTFTEITDSETLAEYAFFRQSTRTQYIKLHSGNLLKVDNGTGGKAYRSTDGGQTYTQVGQMWDSTQIEQDWAFYGGMNDMIKEVNIGDTDGDGEDNYRVFYCADVRAYGTADGSGNSVLYHWEEIFYTDDEGITWQKSAMDTRKISALDHVCESRIVACSDGTLRMYCTWNDSDCIRYFESFDKGATWEGEYAIPEMKCARSSMAVMEDPYVPGTYYMVFVHAEPKTWGAIQPRTRLVLMRSTDGKNWDFLMDIKRWDDVQDDRVMNIYQIVDPSITVTEDYVFVLTGWSEAEAEGTAHNRIRQFVTKLKKSDLTPYAEWPTEADDKDIVKIQATAPTKTSYNVGETLDLTGGYITVYYADGTTEAVSMTNSSVSVVEPDLTINYTSRMPAPDMSVAGEKVLRVDYEHFADNFTITVVESAEE